jgi:hypothetical protein
MAGGMQRGVKGNESGIGKGSCKLVIHRRRDD